MPQIVIVAGPNGAGKTSFANKHFDKPRTDLVYLNADEIARDMADAETGAAALPRAQRDMRAGKAMLRRMDALVAAGASFVFESTLASLTHARKIPAWRQRGYAVGLVYLRLPSVAAAIARVRRRVAQGGHGVPEATVRQRFARSADYLEKYYKRLVDEWYVWDSLEDEFRLAEAWND
jgi:predicted ABC-type ATPase